MVDPSGHSALLTAVIIGAVLGGIYGGVSAVANGQNVLGGIAIGALSFNVFSIASMFWSTTEVELVELPTTEMPH